MSKGVQIAGGATAIALLLAWYAVANLDAKASYAFYQDLSEFRAADAAGEHVKVHGFVVLGSIERDVPDQSVRFLVQNDPPHAGGAPGTPMEVVYASLETPDLFKDGAEVVVEGRLDQATFHADKVFAKCPSKYAAEGAEPPSG
jgi:cytochrome c-type biogenesis protein CcmE